MIRASCPFVLAATNVTLYSFCGGSKTLFAGRWMVVMYIVRGGHSWLGRVECESGTEERVRR